MPLTPKQQILGYAIAAVYSLLMFLIREDGVLFVEVIGLGLPVLAFLIVEWVLPVLVAVIAGLQIKWALRAAINAFPLVIVFACISPFVQGKNIVLPAHLPWMAAAPTSIPQAIEALVSRAPWWLLVYVRALVAGRLMRPPPSTSGGIHG
jgi:hypothetical protein